MGEPKKSVYWVRNDMRLHDNKCLNAFLQKDGPKLAIWTESISFRRAGPCRKNFILQNLLEFKNSLKKINIEFKILKNDIFTFIDLQNKNDLEVYFTKEICPEEISEESCLKDAFTTFSFHQNFLIDGEDLPFNPDDVPSTFTSYRKKIEAQLIVKDPVSAPSAILKHEVLALNDLGSEYDASDLTPETHPQITGGESEGLKRLKHYIWETRSIDSYKQTRNGMIHWDDSSKLSPWLSVGSLSAKFIFSEIKKYELMYQANESTYWLFFELLWRDYFRWIAYKKQHLLFASGREKNSTALLDDTFLNWCQGTTGQDFIDANMNELNRTGWMSNRGRQNVASYLAKSTSVDWTLGAATFEKLLIDYDPSSNWGNWAYLAGVGQDPRDRKFNPDRQANLYDPDKTYRKKWLK
jgi:deoxyribodipyrimidine photo-lyase